MSINFQVKHRPLYHNRGISYILYYYINEIHFSICLTQHYHYGARLNQQQAAQKPTQIDMEPLVAEKKIKPS